MKGKAGQSRYPWRIIGIGRKPKVERSETQEMDKPKGLKKMTRIKKPLVINFTANTQNCDYSWKVYSRCQNSEQLKAMKIAIDTYMGMKIEEMEDLERHDVNGA